MSKKPLDRVEQLEEHIRKLKAAVRKKDKTIKQLKGQVASAQTAFKTTEVYLKEITNGKPLSEVIRTVESGKPLSKVDDECPQCHSHDMKKILFTGFYIISCTCGYRNKIDDKQEITKTAKS